MSRSETSIALTTDAAPAAAFALARDALAQGARALILLAADGNDCRPDDFDPWLRALPVPVCGGVFPQLVHETRNLSQGYLVIGMADTLDVHHLPALSDPLADYFETLDALFAGQPLPPTLMMLVDGMSTRIGAALDAVYDVVGSAPVFFGGGAGSLSFRQKPCLFSNQGMLADHAQLVALPRPCTLAVGHGWEKFAGPFVVTASHGTVVEALDFQPAFEAYRRHVEADSGRRFENGNFFEIAKAYPFGMEKPTGEIIVRDPISHAGSAMHCVGEVPPNSVVHLLKGKPARLIEAAAGCAAQIGSGHGPAILTDCISRVLYLQGDFPRELVAVKAGVGERPLFGMLTLGEIANDGRRCLEFYNKTLVLAALQD